MKEAIACLFWVLMVMKGKIGYKLMLFPMLVRIGLFFWKPFFNRLLRNIFIQEHRLRWKLSKGTLANFRK